MASLDPVPVEESAWFAAYAWESERRKLYRFTGFSLAPVPVFRPENIAADRVAVALNGLSIRISHCNLQIGRIPWKDSAAGGGLLQDVPQGWSEHQLTFMQVMRKDGRLTEAWSDVAKNEMQAVPYGELIQSGRRGCGKHAAFFTIKNSQRRILHLSVLCPCL